MRGAVVDTAGNATICGYFTGASIDFGGGHVLGANGAANAAYVASFDATGGYRWGRTLAGATNSIDICWSIAVDPVGNVTAAGEFDTSADFRGGHRGSAGRRRHVRRELHERRTYRWSHVFHNEATYVRADATDAAGNVMVGTRANKKTSSSAPLPRSRLTKVSPRSSTVRPAGRAWSARSPPRRTSHRSSPTAADSQGNLVTAIDVQGDLDLGTGALAAGTGTDLALAGLRAATEASRSSPSAT